MINVENLTRTFGPKTAVDRVSFQVGRGEVLGFLGPNGAGKSTTMRMITGYIPPTAGRVTVCGFDVAEQPIEARRRIGYLPESAPSYHDMTRRVVPRLRSGDARVPRRREEDARSARRSRRASSQPVLHQSIDTLSKGFRHRTCLAQAMIHDPEVLILDEPTDGLDPNQKHEVRTLIKPHGGEQGDRLLDPHPGRGRGRLQPRAIIIDRGAIVANGTPDELKARSDHAGAVLMTLRGPQRGRGARSVRALCPAWRAPRSCRSAGGKVAVRAYPDRTQRRVGVRGARRARRS